MLNILAARKLLNFSLSRIADTNSSLGSGPIRDEDSGHVTHLHEVSVTSYLVTSPSLSVSISLKARVASSASVCSGSGCAVSRKSLCRSVTRVSMFSWTPGYKVIQSLRRVRGR